MSESQLRWELADAPHAQSALFDESIFEREPGHGEFRGMEFLHVRAKRIINDLGGTPFGFRYTINAYRGCSHACAYCESGDTPILLADGRTKPLADVRPGDWVYGTVRRGSYRRYVRTEVLDHWSTTKPAYRIRLSDGTELVASADHRFLSNRGWKHVTGTEQGPDCRPHLTLNNELIGTGRFADPPKQDDDYRRGYLCGMIRGDGTIGTYTYPRGKGSNTVHRFRLALIDDEALDRSAAYLDEFGIATTRREFSAATRVHNRVLAIGSSRRADVAKVRELVAWPLHATDSWTKGFLAGIFDAEGSNSSGVFRIANNDLEIIDWACRSLDCFELPYIVEPQRPKQCGSVRLLGGLPNVLRFFHLVDPAITRKRNLSGRALKSKCHLKVMSIEPLGIEIPMYDITTGTGDFIANGVVSHNCFARPTHAYLDLNIGDDFDRKIVVKVNAVERAAPSCIRRWAGEPIAMGTNTDPYQRCEGKYRLTQGIIEALTERSNPFSILTKSTLVLRDLDLLVEASKRTDVRELLHRHARRRVWRMTEPGTPHPRQRIKAVETLNNAGVACGVLMAPILPGLSDGLDQLDEVVRAQDAGAVSISPVLLHLGDGTKEVFYERLEQSRPDLLPMYRRMYGAKKYAPKADRDRITAMVNKMIGKQVWIRPREAHPAPRPTQLNLL